MLDDFSKGFYFEFNDVLDCIWKFNRQLDEIKKEEVRKLDAYFGDDEVRKQVRWSREGRKVEFVFPLALSYSFVGLVFIQLETKLMRLCDVVWQERQAPVRAKDLAGSGIDRYMTYLERIAMVKRYDVQYWEQIAALQKIRNCIVHTAGVIEESRDAGALKHIIASGVYLAPEKKFKGGAPRPNAPSALLAIAEGTDGDQLIVKPHYPWLVAVYSRDFLLDVVRKLDPTATDWIEASP
jgi:hypothetical protein